MEPMGLRFSDESVATVYDRLFTTPFFELWGHVLIELVGIRTGDAVLDVATGPGTVARLAAAQAGPSGRVVGADISAPMLEVARQKPPPAHAAPMEFVQAPADAVPLADESFDVVVCQQGLQFVPDQVAALWEMRRLLKPGGRLGIAVWAKGYGRDMEQVLTECLVDVGARPPIYPSFGTRADDLPAALSAVGFSSIRSEEKTLQLTFASSIDRVIEGWGAGPMRSELLALRPAQAEQFRTCVARQLQRFTDGDCLRTPSVARLATASK